MTRQKNLKRRVRSRMEKTGERYAAARRQVLARPSQEAGQADAPAEQGGTAGEPIAGQRISDQALRDRTGRGWEEWYALLDERHATQLAHAQIAAWLSAEQGVPGWWAQTITVGYEQARGVREPGQVAGGFAANASRTIGAPPARVFEALVDDRQREEWLPAAPLQIRTARAPRSVRANWEGGVTRVQIYLDPKAAESRTKVSVQHERLPDRRAAERMKAFWRERLDSLRTMMES